MKSIICISLISITIYPFSSQAFSVQLGDKSNQWMNLEAAKVYCSAQGARLPTVRELAEYATTLGAIGIRETQYPNAHLGSPEVVSERTLNKVDGFEAITTTIKTPRGWPYATTLFYYNSKGFTHEPCGGSIERLWSSDLTPLGFAHTLSCWGDIWDLNPYLQASPVRCFKIKN